MHPFEPYPRPPRTDNSRHIKRVLSYARPSDYAVGAATTGAGPGLMLLMEKISPSLVGKGGFAPIMRLSGAIGLGAGFVMFYQRSICAFLSDFLVTNIL
jgi:NADH-ubiquinone oxidoreductase complex I, 21 kDa subunit